MIDREWRGQRGQVHHLESARGNFRNVSKQPDHKVRGQVAGYAGGHRAHGVEDCDCALWSWIRVRAVRGEGVAERQAGAFPAGALAGNERGHMDSGAVIPGVDPRTLRCQACPVGPYPQF